MRRFLLIFLLLSTQHSALGTRAARCEPFNLEPPPIGDRSAGMGGTGVAAAVDASAIYFNPAGLALLREGRWHSTLSGYAEVGGARQDQSFLDKDMEVATLDGMLGFGGFARAFSWGGVGMAFASPERRTEEALRKFGPLETTLLGELLTFQKGSLFIDSRTTTLEAGPAAAVRTPGGTLAAGAQLSYSVRRSQIARAYSLTDEKGNFYALQTSFQQLSQALRVGYGVRWQATPALAVGSSFAHYVPLSDTISVSRLTATIDQDQVRDLVIKLLSGEISQQEAVEKVFQEGFSTTHGEFDRPMMLRGGVEARLPGEIVAAADLVVFFATEQGLSELPPPFDAAKQEAVLNFHIGGEKRFPAGWILRGGFYTDRSTQPPLSGLTASEKEEMGYDRRTPRDADLYHLTAGAAFGDLAASVSLSVNYGWGKGNIIDILGNVRQETRQDLMVGLGATLEF